MVLLDLAEFTSRFGGRVPARGVVEIFAQQQSLHFSRLDAQHRTTFEDWDFLIKPRILESTNASATYSAVTEASRCSNASQLEAWCKLVRFLLVHDCPDQCGSNLRMQFFTAGSLPNNAFYIADSCASHRIHRIVATCSDENKLAGDLHAIVFSCISTSSHEKMLKAWRNVRWELLQATYRES
jgi:hypothetical protein